MLQDTAGKIENCQIGVFLSYMTQLGKSLIDRELYVPQQWHEDKSRSQEAGIIDVQFRTKPQLAIAMLDRAFNNGIYPC